MTVDRTKTILGRVKHIVIDGTNYPVESTGVAVTQVFEYQFRPIVGSSAPRKSVLRQYYRVDALLVENTLAALKIAWNLSGAVTAAGAYSYINLGVEGSPTNHTLQVDGYVWGTEKYRRYNFHLASVFETKPQQHTPTGLVLIPIAFFCLADETQSSGQEFGQIQQDTS